MRLILAAAAFALASPALAQTVEIPAGTYEIDKDHTQLSFTVFHLGISDYTGQFIQPTGTLTLDPGHPENDKVAVTFRTDSVITTTPALDKHLKTADFFDTAKYPEATFVSTKVAVTGKTALITGNLTLHGVTKPVVLATKFSGAAQNPMSKVLNVGFSATTTIKRSDFGMTFLVPLVSDEVRLTINAAFAGK